MSDWSISEIICIIANAYSINNYEAIDSEKKIVSFIGLINFIMNSNDNRNRKTLPVS